MFSRPMRYARNFLMVLSLSLLIPPAPAFSSGLDINDFINANSVTVGKVENAEQAKKLAFDYFQEKFGEVALGGKIADFAQLAEDPEFLKGINDSLGEFGDYLTYYNLVNQIAHNQQPEAMVTAVKFAYGKALEKIIKDLAWEGLKKSLLAVDLIDYSLSKFISTTLEDYKEFWKGFYYYHYTHAPYSRQYWYDRFKRGGYAEIEKELLAFWDKSDVLIHAAEYGQDVLRIQQGIPATYRDAYAAFDQNFRMGLAVNVFKDHIQPRLAYEIEEQTAKAASDAILEMERIEEKIRIKMKDFYFTQESGNLTVILNQPEWEKWVNPIADISITLKSGKTEKKYDLNEYILSDVKLRKGNWNIRVADKRSKPVFQIASAAIDLKSMDASPETKVEINLTLTKEGEKKVADAQKARESELANAIPSGGATESDYSKKYFELKNQIQQTLSDVLDEKIDLKEFKTKMAEYRKQYEDYLKADEAEAKRLDGEIVAAHERKEYDRRQPLLAQRNLARAEPDRRFFKDMLDRPHHLVDRKIGHFGAQLQLLARKHEMFLNEYFEKSRLSKYDEERKYLAVIGEYEPRNLLTEVDYEIKVVRPVLEATIKSQDIGWGTGWDYDKNWMEEGKKRAVKDIQILESQLKRFSTLADRLEAHINKGKARLAVFQNRVKQLKKRYVENDQRAAELTEQTRTAIRTFETQRNRIPQNGSLYQNIVTFEKGYLVRADEIMEEAEKILKRISAFKKNIQERYREFSDIYDGEKTGTLEYMAKQFEALTQEKDEILTALETFPRKMDIDYTLYEYSMVENAYDMYKRKVAESQSRDRIVLTPEALERIRQREEEMRRQQERDRLALEEKKRREEEVLAAHSRSQQIENAVKELTSLSARADQLRQDTERTRRFFNDAIAAQNQSSFTYFYLAVKDLLESSERNVLLSQSSMRTLEQLGAAGKGKNILGKIQEAHTAIKNIYTKMQGELRPLVADVSLIEENRGYRTGNLDVEDVQVGIGASAARQNATVSFTVGGGSELDFASGALVSGNTGDIGTFGGATPSFENISGANRIRSMGGMNFNIAPTDTSTYSTFAIPITAGTYYAVITKEGNFGKIHVIALAGGSVTLEWFYQPNGSPVF